MKKNKHKNHDEDPEEGGKGLILGGPPPNLDSVISSLFAPAPNASTADDLVSGADLFDVINQHCDASKEDIYQAMRDSGFLTTTAGGELFWMVMEL
ncbi:MAG: hypothetical protein AB7C90_05090 [Bacteroidales bacterium]